ncbi:hypothetical protein CFC21_051712 [Triticum aestivum]|uniref:Uncharacterized protein n=2 Tax=Triticum aestivum TaxID=4565 RepID=A0A9R1K5U6_WHEAT|nr:hypothetical protein CFC21_051712 [Triticum aestivum]
MHHLIREICYNEVYFQMSMHANMYYFFMHMFIHAFDKRNLWHKMPVPIGLLYLNTRRTLLEKYNLLVVGSSHGALFDPKEFPYRTGDGKYNDPHNAEAGSQYTFFWRNMKPVDQQDELLARREYKDTGKRFNILAVAWIQFMIEIAAPKEVANECPLKSFKSAVYGNNEKHAKKIRTYDDGTLVIGDDGLLLHEENGVPLSGDVRNGWVGVLILHALFLRNTMQFEEHPNLSDEELYRYAKLVTFAVIAKIHTIDWTVELLKTKIMKAAMHANWYGLLDKKIKYTFAHIGGTPISHGVPYSLTEEFTRVYRMYIDIGELVGLKGEDQLSKIGFEKQKLSMGYQACGALELWNYPSFFRDLIPQNLDGTNRSDRTHLAALQVYRDRERSVPRYNEFRRRVFLIPIKSWEDLTSDKDAIEAIRAIYGDDRKKIKGFSISETTFNIFIFNGIKVIFSSHRFITSNFNEKTYTKKGMQWVKTTEGLRDVINRHYPEITANWMKFSSAFSMWDANY